MYPTGFRRPRPGGKQKEFEEFVGYNLPPVSLFPYRLGSRAPTISVKVTMSESFLYARNSDDQSPVRRSPLGSGHPSVQLSITKKQYSQMGLSGSAIETDYAASNVEEEAYDVDQRHAPNERREASAFTPDIMRVANILTLKDDTRPVGGFKFKVFRYSLAWTPVTLADTGVISTSWSACILAPLFTMHAGILPRACSSWDNGSV